MDHPLPYDLIVFDADGTLRGCTVEGQPCPNKQSESYILPKVKETLGLYDWDNTGLGIISNQGGVALGYLTEAEAFLLLDDLTREFLGSESPSAYVYMCPHAPTAGCPCRKPSPMMLNRIIMEHGPKGGPGEVQECKVLYVGDMESDRVCAEAAGVDFMWAKDFFGWAEDNEEEG